MHFWRSKTNKIWFKGILILFFLSHLDQINQNLFKVICYSRKRFISCQCQACRKETRMREIWRSIIPTCIQNRTYLQRKLLVIFKLHMWCLHAIWWPSGNELFQPLFAVGFKSEEFDVVSLILKSPLNFWLNYIPISYK